MLTTKVVLFNIIFFVCLVNLRLVSAQKYELGFGVGAVNYKGDLAPNVKIENTRPGGHIFFRINFSHAFSVRSGIMAGMLSANDVQQSDPFLKQRDFGFSSLLTEFNTVAEYHFFDFRKDNKRLKYSPYIFGGIGIAGNLLNETRGNVQETESSSIFQVALPFGVGIKKIVNDKISLSLEFSTTKTFSDNTDLISNVSEGPRLNRVSRSDLDSYYYLNFTISYRILELLCPKHLENLQ